jgi:histone acetyltransferase (RNA polymerase elongator complex component)
MEPIVSTKVAVQFKGVEIHLNAENAQIIGRMLIDVGVTGGTIAAAMKAYRELFVFGVSDEQMAKFFQSCLAELQKKDEASVVSQ